MRSPLGLGTAPARLMVLLALLVSVPVGHSQAPDPTPAQTLEERIRALEEANRQRPVQPQGGASPGPAPAAPAAATGTDPAEAPDSPVPNYTEELFRPFSVPRFPNPAIKSSSRLPLTASFGPGFMLRTADEEFSLQVHYESQIE